MSTFLIEIQPKKLSLDPLANAVQSSLIEAGEPPATSLVQTQKLYRVEGDLTLAAMNDAAKKLLVDPVVETAKVKTADPKPNGLKPGRKGWVLDIWFKAGVTDPVGETVEKGLRDLGLKGYLKAFSATRYIFPKIEESEKVRNFARAHLANELIHDIDIHPNN